MPAQLLHSLGHEVGLVEPSVEHTPHEVIGSGVYHVHFDTRNLLGNILQTYLLEMFLDGRLFLFAWLTSNKREGDKRKSQ